MQNKKWRYTMTTRIRHLGTALFSLALMAGVGLAQAGDSLRDDFVTPLPSARPWVLWFPLNGNLTQEGITADLEAMAQVGIGGALYMEVDQGTPKGPADFAGPLWMRLIQHACNEAKRLGLEINMNNDAGWTGSGGPWIPPALSMQKVVWSEVRVESGASTPIILPQPKAKMNYYQDIVVLAMPTPTNDFRIPNFDAKSGFTGETQNHDQPALRAQFPPAPAGSTIPRERMIDVTQHMDQTGKLAWTPPAGAWLVMRFGHTTTGQKNFPAPSGGHGLECDKFSKDAITLHFNQLMGKIIAQNRALTGQGKALTGVHVDSWEVCGQNWTPLMRAEFKDRRGYDPLTYLPTFAGYVIDGTETSERFLWDLRQTISELCIQNYGGMLTKLANENGLRFSCEAYDGPYDFMAFAGQTDEPMAEFWNLIENRQRCAMVASAGHVYGKNIIGAEAFTSDGKERWLSHPGSIKSLGDWAFCEGINRFVFHRFAAQPFLNVAPGISMGGWGMHYERTQTWWEQSKPWHDYLTRCQYLLRQGLYVADIAYLTAEGAPRGFLPRQLPAGALNSDGTRTGYGWDACPADVVLTRMSAKNGRLVLPDGMSYRALVVPEVETMTPALLAKLEQFAEAGVMIVASPKPPRKAPGLADRGTGDERIAKDAAKLWASGKILSGKTAQEFLAAEKVKPDFTSEPQLKFIHRRSDQADIYFVVNPLPFTVEAVAQFRITGKQPELWWPDSGRTEKCISFQESDGITTVQLHLKRDDSVFVVFRTPTPAIDPIVTVRFNDLQLWSVTDQDFTVLKATYGIPGEAQRSRDVTPAVQRLVTEGKREIAVRSLTAEGDPASGMVKTLTVEYTVAGHTQTRTACDGATLTLVKAQPRKNVEVTKAIYGVLDNPQQTIDIKERIQKLVNDGQIAFQVGSESAGRDPAGGVQKTMVIEGVIDGKPIAVRGVDSDSLIFDHPSGDPIATVSGGQSNKAVLLAWKAGHYELHTASKKIKTIEVPSVPAAQDITGPWNIHFAPKAGGPGDVTFATLEDWSKRPEDGIKYYSGTALYKTTVEVAPGLANAQWLLDLGTVEVMAEVTLNGKNLGTLWKAPYQVDVSQAIKAGTNELVIKVVNLWVNRQIGDEHLPEDSKRNNGGLLEWPEWLLKHEPSPTGRLTFTTRRKWKKDEPLVPSGLIGPVRLLQVAQVPVP